jgi:hypothetical protein
VTDNTPTGPDPEKPTIESLQREIAELRFQLARKTTEADLYRETVYDLYRDKIPFTPMTEEEARELMNTPPAPPGESLGDLIADLQRELRDRPHASG